MVSTLQSSRSERSAGCLPSSSSSLSWSQSSSPSQPSSSTRLTHSPWSRTSLSVRLTPSTTVMSTSQPWSSSASISPPPSSSSWSGASPSDAVVTPALLKHASHHSVKRRWCSVSWPSLTYSQSKLSTCPTLTASSPNSIFTQVLLTISTRRCFVEWRCSWDCFFPS